MATVSKNIFWSLLTSALQLYTGSVVFIVLAKLMSVSDFGILSFGFSLSALVVIVADFGFSLMVIKGYPQRETGHAHYVSNSVVVKIVLALVASILFLIYLFAFYKGEWIKVGALYIVFAAVSSFVIYLQAVLKAQNRFHKFTESTIVYAAMVTISVILYWQIEMNLIQLVMSLLFSKLAQLVWTLKICKNSFSSFSYDSKLVKELIGNSWSFGLHTILGIFYFMIDTQIIALYLGAKDVAMYQAVFRIVLILLLLSDIATNVLLPYLSFQFYKKKDLSELVSKILLYLLILGCSTFLLFTTFKSEILTILYTREYVDATVLVLPFSIVIILRTVSSVMGNILTVSDKQVYRVVTVGISLLVSGALNLTLIPVYGILGAAWVSVVVHCVLFGLYFFYSRREISTIEPFSFVNLTIIAITALIYFGIDRYGKGSLFITLAGVMVWLLTITIIMKRNNNLGFLQSLLKERGVG